MKRLLLIGDPNSLYVHDYANQLRTHYGPTLDMDLFATHPSRRSPAEMPYNQISGASAGRNTKRSIFRPLYLLLFLIKNRGRYDVVHVLYCIQDLMVCRNALRKSGTKLILTVFGSDHYQLAGWKRGFFGPVFRSADVVTTNNTVALEELTQRYGIRPEAVRLCRFGFRTLDKLTELKGVSQESARKRLGLPIHNTIVCIGYNYDPIQQHLAVLRAMQSNEALLARRTDLHLIFPMTYGTDKVYREELLSELSRLPFSYTVFDTFLSDEENAMLRRAPDILIQVQKSDSFSASTQEHMYAGNLLITGSWLPYRDLTEAGIYFRTVAQPEAVAGNLAELLMDLPRQRELAKENPGLILRLSSWESNLPGWIALYSDIPKHGTSAPEKQNRC